MFDPKIIKQEFLGIVGLRQTDDPEFQKLSPNLIYTGENTLINHPLINAENIEMTAKQFEQYNYPIWSDIAYQIGSRVARNGNFYEARTLIPNASGLLPETNPINWLQLNLLSLYLQDIFESISEEVVNEMFNEKREELKTKTLIQSLRFYEGAGNLNDKILNEGKLVGVMISLIHSQNIVNIIERIGLQLSTAAANIPMYVYHSSQPTPIVTILINQTVSGGFQWHNPSQKIKLHNLNQQYDTGGYFFIMYDQNNIGGAMAINKRMNFHLDPCGSCSPHNYQAFRKITKFVSIKSVHVNLGNRITAGVFDPNGIDLWDIEKTKFDNDINWGLNFDFTIRCDLTEFIVRQKDVFAYALRDNIIERLLDNMINSTRQNGIDTKVSQLAQIALSDEKLGGGGLREKADEQIENINFEMSDLDHVCMPCAQNGGIRIKSFGLQRNGRTY